MSIIRTTSDRKSTVWTDAELALLRDRFADTPTTVLAELLGRSPGSVRVRAYEFGLHKPNTAAAWRATRDANLRRLLDGPLNVNRWIAENGDDEHYQPAGDEPLAATNAKPGSEEKVAVLIQRVERGEELWHSGDKQGYCD